MKKVILLIFILGLSCGALITGSINLAMADTKKIVQIQKTHESKEVKKKIKEDTSIDKKKILDNTEKQNKAIENAAPIQTPPQQPIEEYVTIKIDPGFTSEMSANALYDAKLIADKDDFKTLIKSLELSSKIRPGEKVIKKGSNMLSIIYIITN